MRSVAEGATMGDVVFGYVYDFGSGEEWTAERGKGGTVFAYHVSDPQRYGVIEFDPTGRVLSLEDRSDPVALLGSLINARSTNRLTVVCDGGDAQGTPLYVAGAKAADTAEHPALRAEITRMQDLGYLVG